MHPILGSANVIHYEFPINERIRTLLRLEDLYDRTAYYVGCDSAFDHHTALLGIFEIMEVAGRADLKSDLLQELERQRQSLNALRNNPHISEEILEKVLSEIEMAHSRLLAMTGKVGQHLRENEWLMAIKQRVTIPGGVSEFDLPTYHYWKQQDPAFRRAELQQWFAPLLSIRNAQEIVLRLLRDSCRSTQYTARNGTFQQMSGGKVVQLLRITLASDVAAVPELSANRYAINVRFVIPVTTGERSKVAEADIPFTLGYCNL